MTDVMEPQPKPDKKNSDLVVRALSAIVLGPPVLAAVYLGSPYSDILIFVCAGILSWEWAMLCGRKVVGATGAVLIGSVLAVTALGVFGYYSAATWAIPLAATCMLLQPLSVSPNAEPRQGNNTLWLITGLIYISLSCLALLWIRNDPSGNGFFMLLWVLLVVWATDIGAYFTGRKFGGPKIAPRISPKKTWSGLVGGMVCAALVSLVCSFWQEGSNAIFLMMSGAVLAVVAQIGDFFESHIKRKYDAKDSSNLIPGHGGLFDRVDGLVSCAIFVVFFQYL
ncbi:phosphatidate cytidylyltransferase [Kiloniella laminariae]|uniref:Phosphatidate cytidylyltransferase n=1 Tax=Kiloniella laminariae TaxID=454162 RepID=A0ABT4LQ18_9PROT|nr:phosphatidate cytidylyltransferase [Kiloniella laminariae]MCZ4282027.1 phosphatidate cytidylyltransferase [Kiloniella laminariae]